MSKKVTESYVPPPIFTVKPQVDPFHLYGTNFNSENVKNDSSDMLTDLQAARLKLALLRAEEKGKLY